MPLTVAIPTFDRSKLLAQTVAAILPQCTPACQLLVLDNHSPETARDVLKPICEKYPAVPLTVVRNAANIGGNSNFLRCIEYCKTEWVWTLSDDDVPSPNSIATILEAISNHPDASFITFAMSQGARRSDVVSRGCFEFVRSIDSIRQMMLISNNVYNVTRVSEFLKLVQNYTYSGFPQVALALTALGRDAVAVLARTPVIEGNAFNPENAGWPLIQVMLGRMTLLELPMDSDTQRVLARKILADFPVHEAVTLSLAAQALTTGDVRRAIYLYDAFAARDLYFDPSWWSGMKRVAYRFLVRFPRLAQWLVRRTGPKKVEWFERMAKYDIMERV